MPRLFRVSDRPNIVQFDPRIAPTDPGKRQVIWAIEEAHLGNQLLPRDCPRVCFRSGPSTSPDDVTRFLLDRTSSRIVAIESAWWGSVEAASLWVYEMPDPSFSLFDETAGYYTSEDSVTPVGQREVANVPAAILDLGYELRVMPSLWPLRESVIASTLAFSVIRWRNAGPDPRLSP